MNLSQLHYFRVLAKLEHYTMAAEKLNISQPTLSQSISSLENELHTFLFEKQGRNVILTKSGKTFLKYVEEALDTLEAGKHELKKLSSIEEGKVSIGFISTVGNSLIPNLISQYFKVPTHSSMSLTCSEKPTSELIMGLKNEIYDFVICSKRNDEHTIDFVPILEGQLVIIVPKTHPLANKKEIVLKETMDYPFIAHTHDSGMRALADSLFKKANIVPKIAMEVQEDKMMAELVEANHGIALVQDMTEIRKHNVKIVPLAEPESQRFIYMATVKNRALSPAAYSLKLFILDHCLSNS